MNARSRLLVGASLLALGLATMWIAATQAEENVRYVGDLLVRPTEHTSGAYTLLGVPQPEHIPVTGPDGTRLVANPHFANETRSTTSWLRDGERLFSTHTLRIEAEGNGTLRWTFRNETRHYPTDPEPALPPVEAQWWMGRAGDVFPVVAFSDDGKVHPDTPRIWAHYGRAPENPMQPKPSQFTGRLLATLPDGRPLPEGALVFSVEEFTAGCSSKFLPPAYQE